MKHKLFGKTFDQKMGAELTNALVRVRKMKQKGIAFSFVVLFASIIWLLIIFLMLNSINQNISEISGKIKAEEFKKNSLLGFDSMIKNHDENNALNGLAFANNGKKRAETGVIETDRLQEIKDAKIKKMEIIQAGEETQEYENSFLKSGECISLKRMVVLKDSMQKAVLGAVYCNE